MVDPKRRQHLSVYSSLYLDRREAGDVFAQGQEKENSHLNFLCGPKWPDWEPLLSQNLPKKVHVGHCFAFFPQKMRHINFFMGPRMGSFGWGQ